MDDAGLLRREIEGLKVTREAAELAQRRLAFLGEAGRRLSASLDYSTTLESVARLPVPTLGDVCAVLLNRDRATHSQGARWAESQAHPDARLAVEAAYAREAQEGPFQALLRDYLSAPLRKDGTLIRVLRTGASVLVSGIDDRYWQEISFGVEQRGLARELGLTSLFLAPLKTREGVLGVLLLGLTGLDRAYCEADLALAEELAGRASIAIEHALLHRAEQLARAGAERALEAQGRLAALVEASDVAIVGIRVGGIIESWNRAAERVFGYSSSEIVGQSMMMLVPPEHAAEIEPVLLSCARGELRNGYERVCRRKNGTDVPISISLSAIRDAAGELAGFSAMVQDITELWELRERLALADRMAAIGALAAGVAHEINNPLAYVLANLRLLEAGLKRVPRDIVPKGLLGSLARFELAIADAHDGASRVAEIVRDFKVMSRTQEEARSPADLRSIIDMALKLVALQIRHRARIVKAYGNAPRVLGNEARLVQVFTNLIINAAQAMPEDAPDRNEIRLVTREDTEGCAIAEIHDTGAGIAPEILGRVFEACFTTKPVGIGTGMGLWICRGIIVAHGGEIVVESQVGVGTVMRVVLPAWKGDEEVSEEISAPSSRPTRRGRLLIIDDEVKLGTAIQRELSNVHDVEFLTNGGEALARLRGGERFDVILCDLLMPSMSGMALYQELQAIAPDQAERMIFLTGGAFTATAQSFLSEVSNRFLEKPFDLQRLHAVVHEALQ